MIKILLAAAAIYVALTVALGFQADAKSQFKPGDLSHVFIVCLTQGDMASIIVNADTEEFWGRFYELRAEGKCVRSRVPVPVVVLGDGREVTDEDGEKFTLVQVRIRTLPNSRAAWSFVQSVKVPNA